MNLWQRNIRKPRLSGTLLWAAWKVEASLDEVQGLQYKDRKQPRHMGSLIHWGALGRSGVVSSNIIYLL